MTRLSSTATTAEALLLLQEYLESLDQPAAILEYPSPSPPSSGAEETGEVVWKTGVSDNEIDEFIRDDDNRINGTHTSDPDPPYQRRRRTKIGAGQYLVISSSANPATTSPLLPATTALLIPTTPNPHPPYPPPFLPLPTHFLPPEILAFNHTFLTHPDWAASPLGAPETWGGQLRSWVQWMLGCPFPVLLPWGEELVMLYNEPYHHSIGAKHPHILGLPYRDAWPEVWESGLKAPCEQAMRGEVFLVENQELYLMRADGIRETYFTWSLVPIRDERNHIVGLCNINFDRTTACVSERRMRNLHDIGEQTSLSRTADELVSSALSAMEKNPRDINFALVWTVDSDLPSSDDDEDEEGTGSEGAYTPMLRAATTTDRVTGLLAANGRVRSQGSLRMSDPGYNGSRRKIPLALEEDEEVVFRFAGSMGITQDLGEEVVPTCVESVVGEVGEGLWDPERPETFVYTMGNCIKRAHSEDKALVLPELEKLVDFQACLIKNGFGDHPMSAVLLPIRSSSEDRIHGILMIGLNTRAEYDKDYQDYIQLVNGLFINGMATVKLHAEEMKRARYLAALTKQKNEELQVLLKLRTEELRSTEQKFSQALQVSAAGVWLADPRGEVTNANAAFLTLTGLGPDDSLDDWTDRVHSEDRQVVSAILKKSLTQHTRGEWRFLANPDDADTPEGHRWVEATIGPTYDDNGNVVLVSGTLTDVSIRKEAELYQTRRAEAELYTRKQNEAFIDMTSHELRNPLSAISLSAEAVIDRLRALGVTSTPETTQECEEIINDTAVISLCASHMRRLVDDVLSLSKLDSDLLDIFAVPCQPLVFAEEAVRIVKPEFSSHDITFNLEIGQGYRKLKLDWVQIDPARVQQVLINLFTNAIKFTAKSKVRRITLEIDACVGFPPSFNPPPVTARRGSLDASASPISSTTVATYITFSVKDSGQGIDEDESKRLFQRFSQGTPKTHISYGGSGLGLFICKRLTNLLGGDIRVSSRRGKGSVFSFFVEAQACSPPSSLPAALLSGLGRRSSHVEDEAKESHQAIQPSADIVNTAVEEASAGVVKQSDLSIQHNARTMPDSKPMRLLLTEDNMINQTLLKRQLKRVGYIVEVANDGIEALEYIKTTDAVVDGGPELDCILMDIEMPRMGGLECTREIRRLQEAGEINRYIPILAVSANARAGQREEMQSSGMDGAIVKPFQMGELTEKVNQLVMRYRDGKPGHVGW